MSDNKSTNAPKAPTPPVTDQPTPPAAPAPVAVDPAIAAKLAEFEEAIKETKERNEAMAAKEKELDQLMKNLQPKGQLPESEKVHVIQSHAGKAERTKQALKTQPKVKLFVPLEGKEKKGTQLPVTINGYRVNVPKGIYVEVPEQVAQIVMESLNQTQEATDIPQNLDNMDEDKRSKIFG